MKMLEIKQVSEQSIQLKDLTNDLVFHLTPEQIIELSDLVIQDSLRIGVQVQIKG